MTLSFSEYLKKLYNYCGGDDSVATFVTTVLEKIIFNRDNDDLTKKVAAFNMDDNDLRKIFNGKKQISSKSARYIVAHLDEVAFSEFIIERTTEDTRVLLCKEFEPYVGNADKNSISTKISTLLSNIFQNIAKKGKNTKNTEMPQPLSDFTIERELTEIVKTLAATPLEQLKIELTYEPVNVDKKILSNGTLKDDIRKYVIDYYLFVENLFKEASQQNSGFFDNIAEQVKYHSDNFIANNLPQEEVFDKMVDWLKAKVSGVGYTACRIIISFFVQNCEVFHAFTE